MAMHAMFARTLPALLVALVATHAAATSAQQPTAAADAPPAGAVQVAVAAPRPAPLATAPRAPDAAPTTPSSGAPAATAPDPRLAPDAVVSIVLEALAHAGDGAGTADERPLALVYAFASPANRAAVGTAERFADLVRDDAYRPLLGHRRAARGALTVTGDRATQHVLVTTADGARVAYTFTLARQAAGPFRGCWMTDGVTREAPSRLAVPLSA